MAARRITPRHHAVARVDVHPLAAHEGRVHAPDPLEREEALLVDVV